MQKSYKRITIITTQKPMTTSLNDEIRWLGGSLGLFNLRDRDSSCFRIFIEILKKAKVGEGLTSDEIAALSNLSRGTVIHHVNKLIEAGLVVSDRNKYYLRERNLGLLVEELRKDMNRAIDDLKKIADNVDRWM